MMDISLVMFKADGTRRDFPITKNRIVVGRTNRCDLRVPLSSVSRQHCELQIEGDSIHLRDLGSSNGTFHNDNRVQEAKLAAGDQIGIGSVLFTLVIDGEPAHIQPTRTLLSHDSAARVSEIDSTIAPQPIPLAGESTMHSHGDKGTNVESTTIHLEDDPIARLEAMVDLESQNDEDNAAAL